MKDRKEYMKEFMRQKRANNSNSNSISTANKKLTKPANNLLAVSNLLADVSSPVNPELVTPCPECHKKDVYISGLEAQLAEAHTALERVKFTSKSRSPKNNGDNLAFSKHRQAKGYANV